MITPRMLLRGKEFVAKNSLRTVIFNEMERQELVNPSTKKPYSKSYIDQVLHGKRENFIIENVLLELILKRKAQREAIEQTYHKEFEENPLESKHEKLQKSYDHEFQDVTR